MKLATAGWSRGFLVSGLLAMSVSATWGAAPDPKSDGDEKQSNDAAAQSLSPLHLSDETRLTQGSVSIGGKKTPYQAEAGILVVHLRDPIDENPNLKVQLNAGYFDLATPYFAAVYELRQLPIPRALHGNIEMHFYESGHMVYAHEADMKALHDNVAAFIEKNRNGGG